ncbi:MAG: hypothetical protein ACYC40_04625 [Patescibacteria group bacterium]
MKILYLVKEKGGITDTFKELIETQIRGGNDVLVINLYEGNIDYDILLDKIFNYDKVICI